MAKSPYRRPSRRSPQSAAAMVDMPVLEQLEARRLLTTMTVPDTDDPAADVNLDSDFVPEAVFFTYYTQPFVNDPADPGNIPTVEDRAIAVRFILSGTPGAQIQILDSHGRDFAFRPRVESLAPLRTTIEPILDSADGSANADGDFEFTPSGSAAYNTGSNSIETVVADLNDDGLLDLITANYIANATPNNNAVSITYGQGEPRTDEDEPEADGTFGDVINVDGEGEETFAQRAITYPTGTRGAHAIAVEDLDNDGFPEIVVAMRDTDNVAVFQNLGTEPRPEDPELFNFLGFDEGTLTDVGDQPIDVVVDLTSNSPSADIWVLNYGDENISQVVSTGSQRVFSLSGQLTDRELIDADNDGVGDGLGAVGDTTISVGRSNGDTLRGYLSFEITPALITAVTGAANQHVIKSVLVYSGNNPSDDMGYDARLFLAQDNQPNANAQISDFEDPDFDQVDVVRPFITSGQKIDWSTLGPDDPLPAYRISTDDEGGINDSRIQEANDTGNNFLDFRVQGDHPLFGIPEGDLSAEELLEINALSPYRLNSADADPSLTVPTLNITLSDTFVVANVYNIGEAPTSLELADVAGSDDVDFLVTHTGDPTYTGAAGADSGDELWVFEGQGDPALFGEPDADGDFSRDPSYTFSTQRPVYYLENNADIDNDGTFDPIADDSNPNHVVVEDIDGDGNADAAITLMGDVYPGVTRNTSGGAALNNTLIWGGVAVFWGSGDANIFVDSDTDRPGLQPDFLQDTFLGNMPQPIITNGTLTDPSAALVAQIASVDTFFRGPFRLDIQNVNMATDLYEGPLVSFNDLVVGSIDPFNAAPPALLKLIATRGNIYTLDGRLDAQHQFDTMEFGRFRPLTNAPLLNPGEVIQGRTFGLPLAYETSTGFVAVAPDLPAIRYIDVDAIDLGGEALNAPTVDGDILVPDLIITRSDNATPYEIDGDTATRNVQVLLQVEGEPDPVPIFNDGIGQIIFTDADEFTRLTITAGQDINGNFIGDSDVALTALYFQMESPLTTTDLPLDMIPNPDAPTIHEYPENTGRIMIGTPQPRSFTLNEGAYNSPPSTLLRNPGQGIIAEDNQSLDRVVIDGRLLGRSTISGSINVLSVGWLGGDVVIDGDAGFIHVATDAGYINVGDAESDDELLDAYNLGRTKNVLQVGRMLREIAVGGALYTQIKVLGETTDPTNRPPIDQYRLVEHEVLVDGSTIVPTGPLETTEYTNVEHGFFRTTGVAFQGGAYGDPVAGNVSRTGSALFTNGGNPLSNDTISEVQFVGGLTTAIELAGWLEVPGTGDATDFYSFAANGESVVTITVVNDFLTSDAQLGAHHNAVTVLDREGNVLATLEDGVPTFTFTSPYSGIFFLRIGGGDNDTYTPYTLRMQGLAPVSLGQTRSGAATILDGSGSIQTTGGSIGHIAVGQAAELPVGNYGGLDGGDLENVASLLGFSTLPGLPVDGILSAGGLYGITTGGDMEGATISVPGEVGNIYVGYSVYTTDEDDIGDFFFSYIYAESLAYMRVQQSFGGETVGIEVGDDNARGPAGIETTGSIGSIHIREQLLPDAGFFRAGPNSMIDLISVEALTGADDLEPEPPDFTAPPTLGIATSNAPLITTGIAGDVRFLDIPNAVVDDQQNFSVLLQPGNPLVFTDDSGAEVSIRITGSSNAFANIMFFEIDGSEGVAISRIDADLADGSNLIIKSERRDAVTSIGRIRILSSNENSKISIEGPGEIDVYRIEAYLTDGGGTQGSDIVLNRIQNKTPNGDIVAIDVHSLNQLDIQSGNLGETQTSGVGPTRLGPDLGLTVEADGDFGDRVGSAININAGSLSNGALRDNGEPDSATPVDYWLDGLIVRSGDVRRVKVAGRTGDVIVQSGELNRLTANSDNKVPADGFDGIVGSIYADTINRIDVGSGVMDEGESHLARAGIFADTAVNRIFVKGFGNNIEGLVIGASINITDPNPPGGDDNTGGGDEIFSSINRLTLSGGASLIGADVLASSLDDWFHNPNDEAGFIFSGPINRVSVTGGGFIFGTQFTATTINRLTSSGAWDTSIAVVSDDIVRLTASEFRNAVVDGRVGETPHNPFDTGVSYDPDLVANGTEPLAGLGLNANIITHSNWIRVSRDLDQLRTSNNGSMYDLVLEVGGKLQKMQAQDIVRADIDVVTTIQQIDAKGRILSSDITGGVIRNIRGQDAIRQTRIEAAGPIDNVDVRRGEMLNTFIRSDGVDGEIGRITARTSIDNAQIESAGPVQLIQAKQGDVNAHVITFKNGEADLHTVSAGRDIRGTYDIDGDINLLKAKENIGTDPALLPDDANAEFIIAHHDLGNVDARRGQIYTEIRVQGAETGTIRTGNVVTRDGVTMTAATASYIFAGSVNRVQADGPFNATIESQAGGIGSLIFRQNVGAQAGFRAFDGGVNSISISGSYAGSTYADEDITNFSVGTITSGGSVVTEQTIRSLTLSGAASNFLVMAGHNIDSFTGRSSLTSGTVGAGDTLDKASVSGLATDVDFVAGLDSLGADGVLGGGDDIISSGDLNAVTLSGGSTRVRLLAGYDVGPDGQIDPENAIVDDTVAPGLSRIEQVASSGTVTNSALRADTFAPQVPGFDNQNNFRDPDPAPTADAILAGNSRTYILSVTDPDSGGPAELRLNITLVGTGFVEPTYNDVDGNGFFSGNDRLMQLDAYSTDTNTALSVNSSLIVPGQPAESGYAHLATDAGGLTVIVHDDQSLSSFTYDGDLLTNDTMDIDGSVGGFTVMDIGSSGTLAFHDALNSLNAASFTSGTLSTRSVSTARISSGFAGIVTADDMGTFTAGGVWTGVLSVVRDIQRVSASSFQGTARAAGDINRFDATSAHNGVVSAGDHLGRSNVVNTSNSTSFLAGLDVGPDGVLGTGDDVLSNGDVDNVSVGGDFTRSNVIAGLDRGADGFFGTSDDTYAPGIANVTMVEIDGLGVGSNLGTENFGVLASGSVNTVMVGSKETNGSRNFDVGPKATSVVPVEVTGVETFQEGATYTTFISFNQQIETSTLSTAISVSSTDATPTDLVEGTDYELSYDETNARVAIEFSPDVGQPVDPPDQGLVDERPPGVYTITIEADPAAGGLLGRTNGNTLDGDGDGFSNGDATEPDYQRGVLVGDAGDRTSQTTLTLSDNGTPIDPNDDIFATLYAAVDLTGSGIVPINEATTIRGTVGNHPDQDFLYFPDRLDADVYSITVEAGDIVRINTESIEGLFSITLRASSDYGVDITRASDGETGARSLAVGDLESGYVFQRAGTYYLTVLNLVVDLFNPPPILGLGVINNPIILTDPESFPNSPVGSRDVGDYELEILHFRDGDTGFGNTTDGLEGTAINTGGGIVTVNGSIGAEGFIGRPKTGINDADVYLLNTGGGEFAAQAQHAAGDAPSSVALGDVDGDGFSDMAVTNATDNTVTVRLGTATGDFLAGAATYATGANPSDVVLADFDGDRYLDMAVTNADDDTVSVLLNDGDGTFTADATYGVGAAPRSIAVGDLDNDDQQDLAIANRDGNSVTLLMGASDGSFSTGSTLLAGTNPQAIVVGDLNSDLLLDLAVANNGETTVWTYLNQGDGVYAPASSAPVGGTPVDLSLGDVDDDGDNDLAVAKTGAGDGTDLTVLLNNGAGGVASSVSYNTGTQASAVVVANLDGDSNLDIAVADENNNNIFLLFSNGNGTFAGGGSIAVGTAPVAIAATDIEVDGDVDLVTANRDLDNASALLNMGEYIPAGSVLDLSLLLSDLGSSIETVDSGQSTSPIFDTPGVEFALFDVTNANNFSDAELVSGPTMNPQGIELTGHDDFSYTITIPGDTDSTPGTPSSDHIYAVMVQGNQQSDYQLQVDLTLGNGLTPQRTGQNVVLETNGGFVDWLEAFGITALEEYDLSVLGMGGTEAEVLATVVTRLNTRFSMVDVTFATSSAAFEGQEFTSVFLSASEAPPAFSDPIEYGFNDGVDVFNANRNQEAIVYLPKFANVGVTLGFETELANSMSNVIAKELGKTFGLRELDATAADIASGAADGLANDTIMTENDPIAWFSSLTFAVDPFNLDAVLQLDPGEFMLGSGSSLHQLDFALAD